MSAPKEVVTSKMLKMLGMTRAQYDASKLREAQGLLENDIKQQHVEGMTKVCAECGVKLYPTRHRCWECGVDLCEKCGLNSPTHINHLASPDQVELISPGRGTHIPRALRNALAKFGPRPLFLVHESAEMASQLTPTHLHYSWISYAAAYRRAMDFSRGLNSSPGYQSGQFVGICSSNRLEWVLTDLALLLTGLVSVPITTTSSREEIRAIVLDCKLGAVVCSADLAHHFMFEGSPVGLVVLMPGKAVGETPGNVHVTTFEAVEALGRGQQIVEDKLENDGSLEEVPDPTAQNLISLMYTSGSTGVPKGVMIADYSWNSRFATQGLSPVVGLEVVFLPLAHGTARSQYLGRLVDGGAVALFDKDLHDQSGDGYAVLFEHLRALRPTHHVAVPRFWNVVFSEFTKSLSQALNTRPPGITRYKTTEDMYATFRAMFGDRLIAVATGSAATSPEVFAWMRRCFKGLDCGDGYGTTETGGLSGGGRAQRDVELKLRDRPDLGFLSSDLPFPRGEILARSSGRALGYYNRPELSKEVFLEDGWYATGDIGQLEVKHGEQYFTIIDRGGDVFKLAQGEFVVPSKVEGVMMASKYISQIVIYGASVQSSVVAVAVPQLLPHEDLNHPENVALVLADLSAVGRGARLQGYEIPSHIWFDKEPWTPENKLLTPSLKANRPALLRLYRSVFDRLYAEQSTRLREKLLANQDNLHNLLSQHEQLDSFSAVALSERMLREFSLRVSAVSLLKAEGKEELEALVKNAPMAVAPARVNWEQESALAALPGAGVAAPLLFDGQSPVLLTGSTGFLGAHLLEALLQRTRSLVYCLVRGSEERLREHLARQRIQPDYSRIRILVGDLSQERMGLDKAVYEELEQEVGCVLHNASHVNHALSYGDLKADNVDATRECLRLCVKGRPKVLLLVSTASVVLEDLEGSTNWEGYVEPDTQGGYVQSKWVQERMVRHGGFTQWAVPCLTFRPGLIVSHSQTGASNPDDLIMRLIRAVAIARAAPSLTQPVNMVAVDFVAQAIVTLALHCPATNAAFNICSPRTQLLGEVFEAINAVFPLRTLSYEMWLEALEGPSPHMWVSSLPKLRGFSALFSSITWQQLFASSIEDLEALGLPDAAAVPMHHCVIALGGQIPTQAPSPLLPYLPQLARGFPAFNTFTTRLSTAENLGVECAPTTTGIRTALGWLSSEGFV